MDNILHLGFACEKITPEIGCQLYGYSPDVFSTSVHDDLTASAFWFRQGETDALMISATVCLINTDLANRILDAIEKETGIPKNNCLLHATHTHSGPNTAGAFGWGEIDRNYCDTVFVPAILRAAKAAKANLTAVTMSVTHGESLVGINRRELNLNNQAVLGQNPWGPFNPVMTVLSFIDADKKVVANIVHYGAHGTAAGRNTEISRDWSGVMTDVLAEVSGAPTAFFNGPEGDVGPRMANGKTTGYQHVRYAAEHGAFAAQDAVRIYKQPRAYRPANLSVSHTEVRIPLAPRIPLEEAKARYEECKNETINIRGQEAEYYRKVIRSYESGEAEKEAAFIPQTVIRIGDVAFIGFEYELFSEIGMRIARQSGIPHTLSLSNTNGSGGYFITEDQICRGGYEVNMFLKGKAQSFVRNADWHMVLETLKHLKNLEN